MLKEIFSSGTRVQILEKFLLADDEQEFFVRELTRELDPKREIPINSVNRELKNLKSIGLLKVRTKNRKKYFRINKSFLVLEELKSIFRKGSIGIDSMTKKILKMGKIYLLIFSGIFIGDLSGGIDIFMVGDDLDKDKLNKYISTELKVGKDIRYSIFSKNEFMYRLQCKDKFVQGILDKFDNIIAINKLEDEFGNISTRK